MTIDKTGEVDSKPTPEEIHGATVEIMADMSAISDYAKNYNDGRKVAVLMVGIVDIVEMENTVDMAAVIGKSEELTAALLCGMAKCEDVYRTVMSAAASFDHVKAWLPGPDGKLCDCENCRKKRGE